MYFGALRYDPLYLFTRVSAWSSLASFLEEAWKPLLAYVQEFYSYPIRLDGLRTMKFTSATSRDEIIFKAKNFVYESPKPYDLIASRVSQSLNTIIGKQSTVKGGCTTTLTVCIPKRHDHPFWLLSTAQSHDKLFAWDISEDALSFQVTRWGPLGEYSNFYATERAKDIIRNIRATVSDSTHITTCVSEAMTHISNYSLDSCPVLSLGVQLHDTWKHAKLAFSTVCVPQFAEFAVNFIQKIIDSNTMPELTALLQYYQVHSYIYINSLYRRFSI